MRLERFQEGRTWLEKAMGVEHNNEYVISNLAAACLGIGDFLAALNHANRCIELNPRTANHFALQAKALAALGKREEATAVAKQALELDRSLTGQRNIEKLLGTSPKK